MAARMSLVIVLILLCLLGRTSGDGGLNVKIDKNNGGFELSMSGTPWFSSAGVWARNDNKWYTTQDESLILKKVSFQVVREDMGPVELSTFNWMSTDKSFSFSTYIKVYTKQSNVIVFGQVWDNGGKDTSCSNETGFISLWPTFKPENLGKTGYMTYSGNFAAFMKFGTLNATTPVYSNIDGGFPLTVFDNKMENTLVISPFDTFMSASMASYNPKGSKVPIFGLGIVSDVTSVPKGYTMESVIVAGNNVTGTMAELGKLLRTKYKKDETYKQKDMSINYLGYWTDNGGCYYYNTGKYNNYEEAILAVKKASVDNNIPYKYLQLDSWWYYKGMADGVKNWTTNTSVLPNGVKQLSANTGWDIVGHNRYWSNDTDYAKQNGGKFDFILDTNGYAVPNDTHFWKYLLSTAKKDLNLIVYEQDWLDREYQHVNELKSVLNLGETWLNQMGQAALDLGLTIQYCMPWSRHILQSVMNSAVTQIRVSDDYQPGNGQWQVGDTTILSHALGVASFKDTFHSLVTESNCKFMNPEPYPELETYVSALTGGPIGPSDTADHFNKTLIMSTCMSNGLLLKPTRPAMSLEETFLYRAFGTGGPDGVITVAYTEVSQYTWYYILSVNLTHSYDMVASQLPPSSSSKPKSLLPHYIAASTRIGSFPSKVTPIYNNNDVIHLTPCGEKNFSYWTLSPVLPGTSVALFGELDKVLSISEQRFSTIESNKNGYVINVRGVEGEDIHLWIYDIVSKSVIKTMCHFDNTERQIIINNKGQLHC